MVHIYFNYTVYWLIENKEKMKEISYLFFRSLCDTCQSGKLNKEQFALAMWLIKQKLRGVEPPTALSPDMIPPSMRKPTESVVVNISLYQNNSFLLS